MTFATLVHPIISSLIASALFFLTPDQIRDPLLNSTYIGGIGNACETVTFNTTPYIDLRTINYRLSTINSRLPRGSISHPASPRQVAPD
jgi:hypothetical protein